MRAARLTVKRLLGIEARRMSMPLGVTKMSGMKPRAI
jgi:hypothetical protein